MNLEQLGLLGVFIAGAIPWFEAIGLSLEEFWSG